MKIKNIFGNLQLEGTDAAIVKEHISDTVLKLITLFFGLVAEKMPFHKAMERLMQYASPSGIVPASSVKIRCLLLANMRRDLFDNPKTLLLNEDEYVSNYGEFRITLIRRDNVDLRGSYFVHIDVREGKDEMRNMSTKVFEDEKKAIDDFANTLELRQIFLKEQGSICEG